MVTETQEMQCARCGKAFEGAMVVINGMLVARKQVCDPCVDSDLASITSKPKYDDGSTSLWEDVCPPLYRESQRDRLKIEPSTIDKVLAWKENPKGIGLAGDSGTGKTRLMFMLIKTLLDSRIRVRGTTAKQFENWCHRLFNKDDDAKLRIKECHQARVLFIDDIGKEKYTERVESEFYDLVEDRTSHLLPILWTANATGEKLIQMMGDDRGVPIVRRLREFSEVISI